MNIRLGKIAAAVLLAAAACIPWNAFGGISLVVSAPTHAPPPLRVEQRGAAPFRDAVWIDGQWDWRDGNYVWVHGHWEHARTGFHSWQAGQWTQHGHSWNWRPGKWL